MSDKVGSPGGFNHRVLVGQLIQKNRQVDIEGMRLKQQHEMDVLRARHAQELALINLSYDQLQALWHCLPAEVVRNMGVDQNALRAVDFSETTNAFWKYFNQMRAQMIPAQATGSTQSIVSSAQVPTPSAQSPIPSAQSPIPSAQRMTTPALVPPVKESSQTMPQQRTPNPNRDEINRKFNSNRISKIKTHKKLSGTILKKNKENLLILSDTDRPSYVNKTETVSGEKRKCEDNEAGQRQCWKKVRFCEDESEDKIEDKENKENEESTDDDDFIEVTSL